MRRRAREIGFGGILWSCEEWQDRDALQALHIGCGTSTLGVELARRARVELRALSWRTSYKEVG